MKTGYEDWDQNLKTLGGALFPDPSKAAHAYYYGSEARKAQLESNKLINQQNYQNRYGMMTSGGPQPGPLTFQQPGNVPGAAPIAAPPSNLPMAGGPSGLAAAVTNMTPQQAAQAAPAVIEPHTVGTPPPVSPPSAVAPPAPNTTTSDGQVPQNDPVSGVLQAGSVTAPGGGQKQSGPAAANGSPSPMPPGMTLPGLMSLTSAGSLAGLDAASVAQGGQALAYELYSKGMIGRDQYHQMLGATGSPTLATSDTSAASAANVANINAASARTTTGMTVAGENYRAGLPLQDIVAPNDPTQVTRVPLAQLQGKGGTPSYNPAAVTAGVAPVQVQPGGPGTASYSQPAFRAQQPQGGQPGTPIYQAGTEDIRQTQQGAVGVYTTKDDPSRRVPATAGQAIAGGLTPTPSSQDQYDAFLNDAIRRTTDPLEREHLLNVRLQTAALPKGPVTGAQQFEQMAVNYAADQQAYPQPDPITAVDLTVKDPVALTPAAETALTDRVKALRRTARGYVLNDSEARNEARRQLQDEGVLYTPDDINKMRADGIRSWVGRDVRIQNYTPPGGTPGPHMMVGLKPKDGAAATTSPISTVVVPGPGDSNRGRARSAPAATARPASPVSGTVLGPATGVPDGKTGIDKETGAKFIVRGGNYVVQ